MLAQLGPARFVNQLALLGSLAKRAEISALLGSYKLGPARFSSKLRRQERTMKYGVAR